jgi:hypothetical protein
MILALPLLLWACEAEKPEVVDMEDLLENSERYPEGQNPEDTPAEEDTFALVKKNLKEAGIEAGEVLAWNDILFPERFGPKRSWRFQAVTANDTMRLASLSYADSLRVMNSVYNWIDCFGKKCKSVFVGQQVNMQRNAFMLFVGDTSLIYLEANEALNFESWQKYLESLGYEKNWNILIEQKKGGAARWYTFVDEKKINWKK